MRIVPCLALGACITLVTGIAGAQTAPADEPERLNPTTESALAFSPRVIDFGFRLNETDEVGRFHSYLDQRSGPILQLLRYTRDRQTWEFGVEMRHVGYRDQHYLASVERFGRVRASFEWDQVPVLYGTGTRSPYRSEAPGVLRLDDSIRNAVQNGTGRLADYAGSMRGFATRARRDTASARVTYTLRPRLDLRLAFTSTGKTGEQPWGAAFGLSNATAVALPLASRTNDLNTTVEWSNRGGMVRLAYDGSWFENDVDSLTWDNPLRFTDRTAPGTNVSGDASSRGRMSLWPDSTAHTISASGSLALPARSRAFAHVSLGTWLQDDQLLPHTINTAIAPIPLPRASASAEARVTSMNYRFTSRPTGMLWLSGQYRLYDFDNRTPHFPVDQYVRVDQLVGTSLTGGSHAFGYTRHFVDLDASFTPIRFTAFRVGYSQEHDDRTFRFLEQTTDRTVRASLDSTGFAWGMLRLQYDRSVRTGDGLDEQAFGDVGEQVSLRQFDIADRTRDRVSAIVQVIPLDALGLNATVTTGRENRPESTFGLQDNSLGAFTVGLDYAPSDVMSAGISYGIERYRTRQQSRQANPGPQFDDPRRDWWTNINEDVHTVSVGLDVPRITSRTSARIGYDFVGSRARYGYEVRPDTTLTAPQPLPPVLNRFHVGTVDVIYTINQRMALALGYRLDSYQVDDFALSPGTLNSPLIPGFLNMMYQWKPYDSNTGSVRLIYRW